MDDSIDLLDGLDIDIPVAPVEGGASEKEQQFFGPYQLIQEVGAGGVAKVLRARHIHPGYADTTFAIKILHQDLSRDPQVVELFRHEAYVLSMLKHPNIVQTFEAGVQDNKLFIAMEYIDGRDLDNMLVRSQRSKIDIPIPMSMHLVGEVLKGLAYAHDLHDADGQRLNLLHRDVNPANVFLSYDGRVKLGDFGVASIAAGKVEEQRQLAGKVGYFAPEQLEGKSVDQRADIFAMGVMMFEMLTGTPLFQADTADKIMRLNKKAKIPKPSKLNPNIPADLEAVVLRALERRPEDRFSGAREMYAALRPFMSPEGGMSLAVAALMRNVFLKEHLQELQLREGLAGGSAVRGAGQLVLIYSHDQRARAAFSELMKSRSYQPAVFHDLPAMQMALNQGMAPEAALVDVSGGSFAPQAVWSVLSHATKPIPVVAVSDDLTTEWIGKASRIGALDLLFKPFNIERVLASVRAAITGAFHIPSEEASADYVGPTSALERSRLLIISKDPNLIVHLSSTLAQAGVNVDVSPTSEEAIMRLDYGSYHVLIYDAHPISPVDRAFPEAVRSRTGIGLLPVLFLSDPANHGHFTSLERCAVLPRDVPLDVLLERLTWLRNEEHGGRIFSRCEASFPVELRYGGRVFAGEAVDVSRGGMMLHCEQLPPVGMEVGVSCRVPGSSTPIEAKGRVIRVGMASGEHGAKSLIGVEFERFASRGEADLIAFLGRVSPAPRQPNVQFHAPPPARR